MMFTHDASMMPSAPIHNIRAISKDKTVNLNRTLSDENILQYRAQEYSKLRQNVSDSCEADTLEMLVITLGPDAYAIPCSDVDEVIPLQALIPLPNTPSGILGVSSNRGILYAVFDPKPCLNIPGANITTMHRVVLLRHAVMKIGVLADSIQGIINTHPDAISEAPSFLGEEKRKLLSGMTPDRVLVIDIAELTGVFSAHNAV